MELIIDTIVKAIQPNLATIFLLMVCVGIFELANIVLGTIVNTMLTGFDFRKFLFGIFKAILICGTILVFCYGLNLFALTLRQIKINISTELITVAEVGSVITALGVDLTKDILEKIKSIKTLKYVKYDEFVASGSDSEEV